MSTHPSTHPFTHSLAHSLTHSLTHSRTHTAAEHSKDTSIGVAGITLRNYSLTSAHSLCLNLRLQATVADASGADVVVRFDYLDGDTAIQTFSQSNKKNLNVSSFWDDGPANMWPKGSKENILDDFVFDGEGQARVCFENTDHTLDLITDTSESTRGWLFVDGSARRVRVTLALKTSDDVENAVVVSAAITCVFHPE